MNGLVTNDLQTITSTYKRQFIEDIMNGMENILDNSQLTELNKILNKNTVNLIISNKPENIDLNYEETNTDLIKRFIKAKKLKGSSKNTIRFYDSQLIRLKEWSVKSFIEFTTDDIKEYLTFYQELHNCSIVTLDNTRRILSSFWKWMEIEEIIMINPMSRIPHFKIPKKVRKAFTDEEVELLRNGINRHRYSVRNRAIFELLLSSGLRLSEIGSLKIDDISLSDCKGVCLGKGNKERVFYFSERAKISLIEYLDSRADNKEWLFLQAIAPYNKLGTGRIGVVISELGQRGGVENTHPHRFRRTLATRLVRKGMPLEQVSKILGHESLSVTMRYIETDKELLRLVHNKHTN